MKHLVCACTGTPRKDWSVLEFRASTPQRKLEELAMFEPTSKLGTRFQYSDLLVAAAGFIGGHVAYPDLELGAAYDKVMQTRVLGPLGMSTTTLDHRAALRRAITPLRTRWIETANRRRPHGEVRSRRRGRTLEKQGAPVCEMRIRELAH